MKTDTTIPPTDSLTHSLTTPPQPAPHPSHLGSALLDQLVSLLTRFVILPPSAPESLALWILHTYAFQLRDVTTYLGIESPEKRCGKTTLLTLLSELVNRPVVASNISSPAFFRVIEELRPTLLIDEADTVLHTNDQLRGILNSGYTRKTAYVMRVAHQPTPDSNLKTKNPKLPPTPHLAELDSPLPSDGRGIKGEGALTDSPAYPLTTPLHPSSPVPLTDPLTRPLTTSLARFSCWCPKAIAAIGRLPDTLRDRCILIRMQRKTSFENCERLRNLDTMAALRQQRRQCEHFVAQHAAAIAAARPQIPDTLHDRAADIWEPLLALADLAGGDWPERARRAAVSLTSTANEHNPIGSLLFDILRVFVRHDGAQRLFTRDLVDYLNAFTDRPWHQIRKGKQVNDLWLSSKLRPYGVQPKTIRINDQRAKGYLLDDFADTFRRYLPKSEVQAWRAQLQSSSNAPSPGGRTGSVGEGQGEEGT